MNDTDDPEGEAQPAGEILKANTFGPDLIKVGMEVTGMDGEPVGKVKAVREAEFLLDRPLARDLWVPYEFVFAAEGHGDGFRGGPPQKSDVVLTISAAHVDSQGWRHS